MEYFEDDLMISPDEELSQETRGTGSPDTRHPILAGLPSCPHTSVTLKHNDGINVVQLFILL